VNSESRMILHLCVYSMQIFLINRTRLLKVYSFKNISYGRLSAKVVYVCVVGYRDTATSERNNSGKASQLLQSDTSGSCDIRPFRWLHMQ